MTLATDYLGLDALLSAGELAWRDTVRAFVSDRIRPNITAWYESAVFPAEIVPEMGRLGLLGTHLSGYGCPGRSAVEYGLAALELEAGDFGLRTFVSVQGSLAMTAIAKSCFACVPMSLVQRFSGGIGADSRTHRTLVIFMSAPSQTFALREGYA